MNYRRNRRKINVWKKARPVRGRSPFNFRRDARGNVIRYKSYGTFGRYGWEIDHKMPKSRGGSDHLANLQPLQWRANRAKGTKFWYGGW